MQSSESCQAARGQPVHTLRVRAGAPLVSDPAQLFCRCIMAVFLIAAHSTARVLLRQNLELVDAVKALAAKKGCTPGQLALAWVHAQGEDVFPIPGTKRIK